nr:hypothetical protein [uncultured Butyrivibrio sp.]
MGFDDVLSAAKGGFKDILGLNQKAILEIADFSDCKPKKNNAAKPQAGGAGGDAAKAKVSSGFSANAVKDYAKGLGVDQVTGGQAFLQYKNYKKYRFECQFNPAEITINGYGGEELPVQDFGQPGQELQKGHSSTMATASTHIDMSFRLIFDKTNIQDAFYSDKFTLGTTNIAKGVATGIKKAITGQGYSVQPEVEALTAIARDNFKRLARFAWGDMVYEGVINSVSAEYVMFNVTCEPIRAFVNINMVLFDKDVAGAHTEFWAKEYLKDIYSVKDSGIMGKLDNIENGFVTKEMEKVQKAQENMAKMDDLTDAMAMTEMFNL